MAKNYAWQIVCGNLVPGKLSVGTRYLAICLWELGTWQLTTGKVLNTMLDTLPAGSCHVTILPSDKVARQRFAS